MSSSRRLGCLLVTAVALAGCFPTPSSVVGKTCASTDECGGSLACLNGICIKPGSTDPDSPPLPQGNSGDASTDVPPTTEPHPTTNDDAGTPVVTCQVGAPEICTDGFDNDCDTLSDCQDPDCALKVCQASNTAAVCCTTGTGAGTCVDLSTDTENCGSCGAVCLGQAACTPVVSGNVTSGQCGCSADIKCPAPTRSDDDQVCTSGKCSCYKNQECGPGQTCTVQSLDGPAGICFYPL